MTRLARRFMRVPLYHKIVGGNLAVLALLAFVLFLRPTDTVAFTAATSVAVIVAVALLAGIDALLVRLALSALDPFEATARRIERGELDARCSPSPLADDDLLRLTEIFNHMLDRLDEARARQRALAMKVLEAEERERMWLARELYDDTAQILSAALLRLRASGAEAGSATEAALRPLRADIVEALNGIKAIARRLRPPELDELGLSAAVGAHARVLAEVSGIPIRCSIEPVDDSLSQVSRLAVYRILQEGLNNAVRHAGASSVGVRIAHHGDRIRAELWDDGRGFETGDLPRGTAGRFGLIGIFERAAYVDARLTVESRLGEGTRICLTLPVTARQGDARDLAPALPDGMLRFSGSADRPAP